MDFMNLVKLTYLWISLWVIVGKLIFSNLVCFRIFSFSYTNHTFIVKTVILEKDTIGCFKFDTYEEVCSTGSEITYPSNS